MRRLCSVLVMLLTWAIPPVFGQDAALDKGYEAEKTDEFETIRQKLATQSSSETIAEAIEVETVLLRLHEAKGTERARIAAELEAALARLRAVVDAADQRGAGASGAPATRP